MAIGRARYADVAFTFPSGTTAAEKVPNPTVTLYLAGTGTPGNDDGVPLTDTIYRTATGVTTYTNPFTSPDAYGGIEFYLDRPQLLKIVVSGTGVGPLVADYVPAQPDPTAFGQEFFPAEYYGFVSSATATAQTTALQTAIDAAHDAKGGTVRIPPLTGGATYAINGTILVPSGIRIKGTFSEDTAVGSGGGTEPTIIKWDGAHDGYMLKFVSATAGNFVQGGGLEDLVLDGLNSTTEIAYGGIWLKGTRHTVIRRVRVRNVGGFGLWLDDWDTAPSFGNIIENYDFVHGFWTGAAMIGANAAGLVLNGSSDLPATGGCTQNLIQRVSAQYYNGDGVRFRFADNNRALMIHGIGVGAGVWGAAGAGYTVRFQAAAAVPGPVYGFPAGNRVEMTNGSVFVESHTHGNDVVHHTSEAGSIQFQDVSLAQCHYSAIDYVDETMHETHRYKMTDQLSFGAGDMIAAVGTPTQGFASLWAGWALPEAAISGVGGSRMPYHWYNGTIKAVRLKLTFDTSNTSANARLRLVARTVAHAAPGGTLVTLSAEFDTTANYAIATGAEVVSKAIYVDIPIELAYTRLDTFHWAVHRIGDHVDDTVAGNVVVLEAQFSFWGSGPANTGGAPAYTAGPPPITPL